MTKHLIKKSSVVLIWHIHQPCFFPEYEIARQIKESYSVILRIHEDLSVPFSLNITGVLLEQMVKLSPELVNKIIKLKQKGLLELTGSGYYHPLLPLLSHSDARAQIEMDIALKKRVFGSKLNGFWPTDLGWAPWLTTVLCRTGFKWVIIDSPSLTLSNTLPKWSEISRQGHRVLSPDIDSVSLESEVHQPYSTAIGENNLTVFIRDHSLSLELTDHEKGVIYDSSRIKDFVKKIEAASFNNQLFTIGEDGERINTQTAHAYSVFLEQCLDKKISFLTPSKFLSKNHKFKQKYFPASTFQYDLTPWLLTMDDQAYVFYLKRTEELIATLEAVTIKHKNPIAKKYLRIAKSYLYKSQDSGCLFWKFHQRSRNPCWNNVCEAYEAAKTGLESL